jgi:hypothetical protein
VAILRRRAVRRRNGRTVAGVSHKVLAVVVVLVVLVLDGAGGAMARERWRRPLPGGAVAGSFSFERAAPYERGRRRGIDLRGAPGARVVAACGGVVTYAGRVPRWGRGVTLRCAGGLVATELGLASVAVGRGVRVLPGAVVGRLARRGVLRLGARIAARRTGYVDPAALLRAGGEGAPRPTVAPPPGRARRLRRRPPPAGPTAPAPARPAPAAPPRSPLPWPIPAGAALLLAAAAGGGVAHRRHRRRAPARIAVVQR